jgi:phosphoribosylanthranilate isomerase
MVRVKICGITNWADAKVAIDAGADALGFNFSPPSPRAVTPARAWEIIQAMPPLVEAVGVFVNWTASAVGALARALRLGAVQLHGDERPGLVAQCAAEGALAHKVIKAFRVGPNFDLRRLAHYQAASAFLLDGFDTKLYGGTGQRVEVTIAQRAKKFGPIILAGGLTPENVGEAVREVRPYAIDVCSSVETKPGRKDATRLRMFMREVEKANLAIRNSSSANGSEAGKNRDDASQDDAHETQAEWQRAGLRWRAGSSALPRSSERNAK